LEKWTSEDKMPVDIIVGGQAGDEGKGKISAYLNYKGNYKYSIRIGGPNAGHTVFYKGKAYALKSVPSGFVNPKTIAVLGAGCYINLEWLFDEIKLTGIEDRLIIDENAVLISEENIQAEKNDSHFMASIGSVGTGLGQTVKERIERREIKFAKDEPRLSKYIKSVPELLNKSLQNGEEMLLEGTQGMKLSLMHGEYPYVTSRDTTASTFLGEAGLGPKYVRDVYAVFKPYITRVGPGPLENEITDKEKLTMYHVQGREVGSVSKRLRRIGDFEEKSSLRAIVTNSATKIAVTHIDIYPGNTKVKKVEDFTDEAQVFLAKLKKLEDIYPHPKLSIISTGPELDDTIVL
jgi:adenylosuccinate synthase